MAVSTLQWQSHHFCYYYYHALCPYAGTRMSVCGVVCVWSCVCVEGGGRGYRFAGNEYMHVRVKVSIYM